MEYKKIENGYALRIDRGEEIIEKITEFCNKENIMAGSITGIGATDHIVIGLYNVAEKQFYKKEFQGAFEIPSLTGNISDKDGEVYLHCHVVICDQDLVARGGHLVEGRISATAELFITPCDSKIERKFDVKTGLNLFDF